MGSVSWPSGGVAPSSPMMKVGSQGQASGCFDRSPLGTARGGMVYRPDTTVYYDSMILHKAPLSLPRLFPNIRPDIRPSQAAHRGWLRRCGEFVARRTYVLGPHETSALPRSGMFPGMPRGRAVGPVGVRAGRVWSMAVMRDFEPQLREWRSGVAACPAAGGLCISGRWRSRHKGTGRDTRGSSI